nr:transposase [Alteromonas sp. LTR]
MGKSRGGKSTKIHLAVDNGGLPVYFELSGGQVHNVSHGPSLVESSPYSEVVVADKGYDSQALRELVSSRNAKHLIPRKRNSKTGNDDKLARNYYGVLALAFALMWLPMWFD